MNNWWFPYGLKRRLTDKINYDSDIDVIEIKSIFKKSLHIYIIDVGNNNELCFELKALQSPQYNIHRFGIFFSDSPRHSDVLIILGPATKKMVAPLRETINQIPEPFGVVLINSGLNNENVDIKEIVADKLLAEIKDYKNPEQIISVLLKIMNKSKSKGI